MAAEMNFLRKLLIQYFTRKSDKGDQINAVSLQTGSLLFIAILLYTNVAVGICANLLVQPHEVTSYTFNATITVAGSTIQLFCSASGQFNAPRIQWTTNNVTIPETAQLPHLMIKSRTVNTTITSSVLTIYGFSSSDDGTYQCIASDNDSYNVSQPLLLTVNKTSNVLRIVRELSTTISDRISVPLGSSNISVTGSFLRCSAEQPTSSSLAAPSMVWLKDGTQLFGDGDRVVINTYTGIFGSSNRTVSFVRIFNFSQSDAGVYQCVFYDTPSQGGEVITTRPYKVDTGPVFLDVTSPPIINLHPPDPLVIQVEAGGEYAGIEWMRTPVPLNASNGELVDFQQTFVRTMTSEADWGLYKVRLVTQNSTFNLTFNVPANLVKDHTSSICTTCTSSIGELSRNTTSVGEPSQNTTSVKEPSQTFIIIASTAMVIPIIGLVVFTICIIWRRNAIKGTNDALEVSFEQSYNKKQSPCKVTVEFVDSNSHPELSDLYETINGIQHNDKDKEFYPTRQRSSSAFSNTSLGSDYIEVNSSTGQYMGAVNDCNYYLHLPTYQVERAMVKHEKERDMMYLAAYGI